MVDNLAPRREKIENKAMHRPSRPAHFRTPGLCARAGDSWGSRRFLRLPAGLQQDYMVRLPLDRFGMNPWIKSEFHAGRPKTFSRYSRISVVL